MSTESPEPEQTTDISRGAQFPAFNVTVTSVPFFATVIRPFVPFNLLLRNGPFEPRAMWKAAVGGIRALQQLSRGVTAASTGSSNELPPALQVVSGHTQGHVLLWNADTAQLQTSCQHFNNVTVTQVVVSTNYVYTIVEKVAGGSSSDDSAVYMWSAKTLEMIDALSAHDDRVLCMSVDDANEHRVATGGADHLIYLWNTKASTTMPTGKLTGHHSTVTRLILTEHALISGGGDGEVRLWDALALKCLQVFDGHQGQVALMEWSRKPNAGTHFVGSLVTGCHGGFVRSWDYRYQPKDSFKVPSEEDLTAPGSPGTRRTTFSLQSGGLITLAGTYLNKAHKAVVADVAVDEPNGVIFSCSPTDGVNLFHTERKHNVKLNSFSTGVHNIAVDTDRRVLLVGTDLGQLAFFDYKGFADAATQGFGDELITLVAAFQPHLGAITSMLFERARNGRWSRVITTSADSTILTIDFQTERDATLFGTMTTNSLIKTPNGSLLLPLDVESGQRSMEGIVTTTASAKLFSLRRLAPIDAAKKFTELNGRRATSMGSARYVNTSSKEDYTKLVVGTDDEKVRFFSYQMYLPDEPASPGGSNGPEEFIETGSIVDMHGFIVRKVASCGPYVVLCLQRNGAGVRGGALAIADIRTESLVTDPIPLVVYPIDAHLFLFNRSGVHQPETHHSTHHGGAPSLATVHPQDAVLAVQLRTGEVVQLAWRSGARTLVLQRTLVPEQYTVQQLDDGMAPFPSRTLASLNTKFEPPRLNVVTVDGGVTLRGMEASTGNDNATPSTFQATYDRVEIIDVVSCHQGEMSMVVALDSPNVFVVGEKGERLFEIAYDGSVDDCTQPEYALGRNSVMHTKRHRTFVREERSMFAREHPRCTAIDVSVEGRMVAIGYRDGLVQLWDSGTHRVFKRIVAHRSPVAAIWCFGEEKRVLSCATSGYLRADVVWSRSLKDKKNQQQQKRGFGK